MHFLPIPIPFNLYDAAPPMDCALHATVGLTRRCKSRGCQWVSLKPCQEFSGCMSEMLQVANQSGKIVTGSWLACTPATEIFPSCPGSNRSLPSNHPASKLPALSGHPEATGTWVLPLAISVSGCMAFALLEQSLWQQILKFTAVDPEYDWAVRT